MKKDIDNKIDLVEKEKEILKFWRQEKIFQKLKKKVKGNKTFSFIDGPITANNKMGVHHGLGRTIKDSFQRYMAMNDYDQRWQNGFDGQGLWVEVDVEKDLGLNSKKEIEDYGLEKFAKKCRGRVEKYSKIITDQSIRLGQWMNWDNSYQTMSDNNIEHIWHFLKVAKDKDLLYQGKTVLPWCPRCGTSLSSHELYDNYQQVEHKAVYLKYQLTDEKDSKLLVWTTTPWTLPANVAVAVDPRLDYIKVKKDGEVLILAESKAEEILEGDWDVIDKFKGQELVGRSYEGPFDEMEAVDVGEHKIIAWKQVGDEEGTGLVHIAPGCGKEDFELAKEHNLSVINPIDEEGNYLSGFADFSGENIADIREKVFAYLKEKDGLYKTEDYKHRYPLCWRCDEELVYKMVNEWFLKADPIRGEMKELSKEVNWMPQEGGKRMRAWLDNMSDWNISRKRYWGLPLPFYKCSCGELTVIESKEELKKHAVDKDKVDKLPELHRPWIDEIKIICPRCGKQIKRVPQVGDCWLDAGIVPFSTLKYLSDKEYWQKWFPADFVVEMREQIRLWFYSLLFMSTVLEEKIPYRQVLTHGAVGDEKGEEMHKSKGNAIWFDKAAEKMGADVMRWIFLSQNPVYDLRFGYGIAKEVKGKLNTWWNSLYFLITYSKVDDWSPDQIKKKESKNILDRWIISQVNQLVDEINKGYDNLEPQRQIKMFEKFLDDLSNWYIRRSRRRFWKSDQEDEDKLSAYSTLYKVLLKSAIAIAPALPFISEEIYQVLKSDDQPKSVHLNDYPQVKEDKIDKDLNEKMSQAREIVNKALSVRDKNQIKVRQPLNSLQIKKDLPSELANIIKEEVNVKKIKKSDKFKLDIKISDKLKREGIAREIVRKIQNLRKKANYELSDRIAVYYRTDSKLLKEAIKEHLDYIGREVLAAKDKGGKGLKKEKASVDSQTEIEIEENKIWLGVKK